MRTYGGFCPIAKAAEIVAERWTPLIIRELRSSHRFNELEFGLPGISRSLLTQRLRYLERVGIVERRAEGGSKRPEYHLTTAGHELSSVILELGKWGQRWVNHDIGPADVDPRLLMWDMRRRVHLDRLPERRVVVQFDFVQTRSQTVWLILERPEPSVCLHDPGFRVDVFVTADTVALHRVWMGHLSLGDAIRKELVQLEGPSDLVKAFPSWFALNFFAHVPPATGALRQ
jgi:DNA-binding HxlR family transcriptional regulator